MVNPLAFPKREGYDFMETLEDVMDLHEQIKWKEDIKRWAREGGFAASGFTTADPVESLR